MSDDVEDPMHSKVEDVEPGVLPLDHASKKQMERAAQQNLARQHAAGKRRRAIQAGMKKAIMGELHRQLEEIVEARFELLVQAISTDCLLKVDVGVLVPTPPEPDVKVELPDVEDEELPAEPLIEVVPR